jgi:hypothetical protein
MSIQALARTSLAWLVSSMTDKHAGLARDTRYPSSGTDDTDKIAGNCRPPEVNGSNCHVEQKPRP